MPGLMPSPWSPEKAGAFLPTAGKTTREGQRCCRSSCKEEQGGQSSASLLPS